MTKRPRDDEELLRVKGLLYVSLNCVYLQSADNIVISLGQPYLDYESQYTSVLSESDVYGKVVKGYMAQGRVRPAPSPGVVSFRELDHEAACVHTDWIYAHMLLRPNQSSGYPAKFSEAVGLAERASVTLRRVSAMIHSAALDVAERLDIKARVVESDRAAEAMLVQEHPLQASVPRLPFDFTRRVRDVDTLFVGYAEKNEARVAFEAEIMDIFGFGICIAEDEWHRTDEVMLCTTGMRKRYSSMTKEERISSGSVVLGCILRDLAEGRVESAVAASLVAARALERMAQRLHKAVEMYREKSE